MKRSILAVLVLAALLASACLAPAKQAPAPGTTKSAAEVTAQATAPSATQVKPTAAPTRTQSPSATPTPSGPVLSVPAEFADARAVQIAQVAQAQPGLRIERSSDSAAALANLQAKRATWAISNGPQPSPEATLLCLTPYVPAVHFDSPLENVSSARLQAIYQGKDWPGMVYYSGDATALKRLLGVDSFGPQVSALSTWTAVVDRVAGDRSAVAFVPWSEVDARVKTLSLDGRSIAADGVRGYARGNAWWLTAGASVGNNAVRNATADLANRLSCPIKEPITFLAGGDMLMGWFVNELYVKKHGPEYLFERIAPIFRSADIAFGNVENPISSRGVMENKGLMFRASPEVVKGLTYAGIDVVNLANNHTGDYGAQALLDTFTILEQNGIGYVGAGRNREQARSPWITSTSGITVAVLGYNEIEPGFFAATASRPGSAWIEPDNVVNEIKQAKLSADIVIVSFHWGTEYTPDPNTKQREMARRAAEAGAGLIVGHHPHVVQGVGFYGPVFVDYSIGDFVYSQPTRPATGEAVLLNAVIDGPTVKQVQLIPIYIDKAQPYVISPLEAKLMMARIFDATRHYKGLPPSTEQPLPTPSPVALPQGSGAPTSGSLSYVGISNLKSDIILQGSAGVDYGLTTSGEVNDAPAWAPDGRRLAYSSGHDGSLDIFVANADGSSAANITRHPAWDDYPAWSPDGKQIVFSSNRDGPFSIYVISADGSGLRRLTNSQDWDTTPAWSPDGKRIAFSSDRSGWPQIYTINVDGSGLKQLSNHPNVNLSPSWSPDGRQIVYQSYQDESANQGDDSIQDRDYELFVVPSEGGAARQLTDNAAADIDPAWSPDGKRIAFASDRSGVFQIYVMNLDGSSQTLLTKGQQGCLSPAWAP